MLDEQYGIHRIASDHGPTVWVIDESGIGDGPDMQAVAATESAARAWCIGKPGHHYITETELVLDPPPQESRPTEETKRPSSRS